MGARLRNDLERDALFIHDDFHGFAFAVELGGVTTQLLVNLNCDLALGSQALWAHVAFDFSATPTLVML